MFVIITQIALLVKSGEAGFPKPAPTWYTTYIPMQTHSFWKTPMLYYVKTDHLFNICISQSTIGLDNA